ncbi:MAG: hypothetical protein Kow0010_03230 [Dehalococcoidia bacterium]
MLVAELTISEDLTRLRACLWETASLRIVDFSDVGSHAARHAPPAIDLSSCQRREVYSFDPCGCEAPIRKEGLDALEHLAAVAAGLNSVVLGEEQITAQVRAALAEAHPRMRRLGDIALAAARELRREAGFESHSGHLLDRALRLAGVPAQGRVLVVGTGHMGRLVARRAQDIGFDEVIIAGRSRPTGEWFRSGEFRFVALPDLPALEPVDVAVGCIASTAGELDPLKDLPPVRTLVLDLGTPRNFTAGAPCTELSIADLLAAATADDHGQRRRAALRGRLRDILERRVAMAERDSRSPIGALRRSVEQVRRREVARTKRLHPEIPAETLDAITRSLVNQVFHEPSQRLLDADPEFARQVAALFEPDGDEQGPGCAD